MNQATNPPDNNEEHDFLVKHPTGSIGLIEPPIPPGTSGEFTLTQRSRTTQVLMGVAAALFGISLLMSQIFAWVEVAALRHRVNQLVTARLEQQVADNCLAFYRNDVSVAIGIAIAANNALWVSVSTRDPELTDAEQAAANMVLGQELEAANKPLVAAVTALQEYDMIDPAPTKCPHPTAVERRQD